MKNIVITEEELDEIKTTEYAKGYEDGRDDIKFTTESSASADELKNNEMTKEMNE